MRSWARCTCLCLRRSNSSPSSGGDGGRGDISLLKREVSPHAPPKRNPGGFRISTPSRHCDSRPLFGAANRAASSKQARFIRRWRRFACFPHTPLKRPDQGACGPPILDYTPRMGAAAERGVGPIRQLPRKAAPKALNAGEHVLCSWAVRRTRRKPSRFLPHGFARPPHLSKKGAFWRRFCAQASFSSTVHGAFFFGKTKKNGGCIPPSRPRGPAFPAPGPSSCRPAAHRPAPDGAPARPPGRGTFPISTWR